MIALKPAMQNTTPVKIRRSYLSTPLASLHKWWRGGEEIGLGKSNHLPKQAAATDPDPEAPPLLESVSAGLGHPTYSAPPSPTIPTTHPLNPTIPQTPLISNRFELQEKIGEGEFGQVFRAHDHITRREVAVKIEPATTSPSTPQLLQHEYEMLSFCSLASDERAPTTKGGMPPTSRRPPGLPTPLWWSRNPLAIGPALRAAAVVDSGQPPPPQPRQEEEKGYHRVLVLPLYGPNMTTLLEQRSPESTFTLGTVVRLAQQGLRVLEYIHDRGILHRDLKPDNFVWDPTARHLTLIDFGLSIAFRYDGTNRHYEFQYDTPFVGTTRYASLNTCLRLRPSRRDDLESFGYVLLFWLKGYLPWQQDHILARQKTHQARESAVAEHRQQQQQQSGVSVKNRTCLSSLCKGLPSTFYSYLYTCRSLSFEARPNYATLLQSFHTLQVELNIQDRDAFDWESSL